MSRWPLVAAGVTAVAVGVGVTLHAPRATRNPPWPLIERYCLGCHNDIDLAGDVSFERLDRADVGHEARIWEAAVRKLETGLMPPKGEPRPERAALDAAARWLAAELDAAAAAAPHAGAKPLARLNRIEYANAIRDLLHYDADAIAASLPADPTVGGFDNNAAALGVSPSLLEGYALAAMQIGRRAIGDRALEHTEVRYAAAAGAAQRHHLEGLPLGTRGGLAVEHFFPLDAEYAFTVRASLPEAGWDNPTARMVWCDSPTVDVTFNGAPIELGERLSFRLRVPAGTHRIAVALVDKRRCAGVNEFYSGEVAVEGAIAGLVIDGPYAATGGGETESRREILSCTPRSSTGEVSCAEEILSRLATRAYRRPVTAGNEALQVLLRFYTQGREQGGTFESGLQYALARMLVDPQFLYRFEREPSDAAVGTTYPLDDFELATRLSFFLWSGIPDDALLAAAAAGELTEPGTLAREVTRMLADERSERFVANFAGQWLKLRELEDFPSQDAEYDAELKRALREETELLFAAVLRERRSVVALLDADFTFLNERLAAHYGIDGVRGSQMRRVTLPPESPRRGLLGQGSILTVTAAPNRTSPVRRGEWLVQNVLGASVPRPPPGAEADLAAEASAQEGLAGNTVRERLEMHRANPTCAACHSIMDPLGLALENFDLVGRWREQEDGHAIDASTELADGTKLEGPVDLRRALLARSDTFVATLAERLMTYALGRELDYRDGPAVRRVVRAAAADQYTLEALVQAIVASDAFTKRVKTGDDASRVASAAE
jgi:hypothetical protein